MMITLRSKIYRAEYILKTEGLISLLKRGFRFLVEYCFHYRTFYLYETTLKDFQTLNETDFKPKIDNFTLKIVHTNQEADRLEAEGFEFRSSTTNSRQLLDKGGIAFCFFVGRELANTGWLFMNQHAMDSRQRVDFSNDEALGGLSWTNPKYRRMGLHQYGTFKRRQFVFSKGKTVCRADIDKSNITSQRITFKLGRKYGEGRYLKILWWKSWKETYLEPDELTQHPSSKS